MINICFYVISIFFCFCANAQLNEVKNIFDVARTGSLSEASIIFQHSPKVLNEINSAGYSPLILACYRGNNEVAKFFIENGADINYNNDMGTPLMAAIFKKNNEIAVFLIEKKANLNLSDGNGTTALIYAVNSKNYEIVSALVKADAKVDLKDKNNKSAIDYAIQTDDDKLIELLKNKNKKL